MVATNYYQIDVIVMDFNVYVLLTLKLFLICICQISVLDLILLTLTHWILEMALMALTVIMLLRRCSARSKPYGVA